MFSSLSWPLLVPARLLARLSDFVSLFFSGGALSMTNGDLTSDFGLLTSSSSEPKNLLAGQWNAHGLRGYKY